MDSQLRLDRVTAPGYLDDLDTVDTTTVRAMRDDCRAEERQLSFERRVVQGRLDLASADAVRRASDAADPLLDRVTRALTGHLAAAGVARAVGVHTPEVDADAVFGALDSGAVLDLDDDALDELIADLAARERALSQRRAVLLHHLDRLQATLVARYRDSGVALDALTLTSDARC